MKKLQTVGFFWTSSSVSGAEKRLFAIANSLSARGIRGVVFLKKSDADAVSDYLRGRQHNLIVYQIPWWVKIWRRGGHRWPQLRSALKLEQIYNATKRLFWKRLLLRHGINLCHIAMNPDMARIVCRPALFEVTSPDWADRILAAPGMVPPEVPLHAVSESVFQRLSQGAPKRQIFVAPSPFPNVDPRGFPSPDMHAKEKLIVFAHRLIPRKNGILFARAVRRFLVEHSDWRVSIRGRGPDEEAIRELLSAEINSERVNFGYCSELSHELKRASIFVSLIEPDNYPSQSVIEAMSNGNALLLSDQGLSRQKFLDGNGRLTDLNEDAVLKNLCALVASKSELVQMGRRSREIAMHDFSREAYLDHLEKTYETVLNCLPTKTAASKIKI